MALPHPQLQPATPQLPISIRPNSETIATAEPETIITIRNRPEPWHPLDYTVAHQSGATLFTVQGHPWGLAQRRVFRDASGLPLFELRNKWFDSSVLDLKLPGAGTASEPLLSAKCRVAIQKPRAVLWFWNACVPRTRDATARPAQRQNHKFQRLLSRSRRKALTGVESETVMEIVALDVDNLAQVAVVQDQRVAFIDRITDPAILAQGQKPPFRFRPMWRARVARGVDLALVSRPSMP